jgi:hypothetical protein
MVFSKAKVGNPISVAIRQKNIIRIDDGCVGSIENIRGSFAREYIFELRPWGGGGEINFSLIQT